MLNSNLMSNSRFSSRFGRAHSFVCLLCVMFLCMGLIQVTYAQSYDDEEEQGLSLRLQTERLEPTDAGVLNKILWEESSLEIDGKTYRFNAEKLVVMYLNKERNIVGLRENIRIRYQVIDKDYVAAIWVDDKNGMIVG